MTPPQGQFQHFQTDREHVPDQGVLNPEEEFSTAAVRTDYKHVLYCVMLWLRWATLGYARPRYATLGHFTLRYATLRYATLRYATLRYTTL
eukprot:g66684.t1